MVPRSAGVCAAHKRVPGSGIRWVFKGLEHLLGPFPPEAFQDSALGRVLACTEHVCVCGEHLQSCSTETPPRTAPGQATETASSEHSLAGTASTR